MHPKAWQCTSSQYVPSNCADTLCTIWPRPGPNYLPCLVHVHSKCQPLVPAPPCLSLILGWPYGWRDLKIQLLNNFHFASLKEIQTEVVLTCLSFIRSGQNHLARHSKRGGGNKADRGRGGKTTSGNGQAWSSPSPRGRWRTGKNGGKWLRKHLWCPNDPRGWGIDERLDSKG